MVEYAQATSSTSEAHVEGFVRAYQEAFAGPPYFEDYSREQVLEEIWFPHLSDGMTVLALDGSEVVGFGCAVPTAQAPSEVRDYLDEHGERAGLTFDHAASWYMSELGVAESHRLRGIGSQLVKWRLRAIKSLGIDHYLFRTAAEGSNSIHLYKKIGATIMPELQSMAENEQVLLNKSQSVERVYLFGHCETALSYLPDRD